MIEIHLNIWLAIYLAGAAWGFGLVVGFVDSGSNLMVVRDWLAAAIIVGLWPFPFGLMLWNLSGEKILEARRERIRRVREKILEGAGVG